MWSVVCCVLFLSKLIEDSLLNLCGCLCLQSTSPSSFPLSAFSRFRPGHYSKFQFSHFQNRVTLNHEVNIRRKWRFICTYNCLVNDKVHKWLCFWPGIVLVVMTNVHVSSHLLLCRHTWEILRVQFQTTAAKWMAQLSKSHKFFGFPVHIKVILHYTFLH